MKIIKITIRTSWVLALYLCTSLTIKAQNVGINNSLANPNSSAILDLNTGNNFTSPNGEGLLIPNVALTSSTDAITISAPAYDLLVYNLGTAGFSPAGYYYNANPTAGSATWTSLGSSASGNSWLITGNGGTAPGTNFLGTTDGNALEFKVDNQKAGWLDYTSPYNTFLGYEAGNAVTSGTLNTALGIQALASNTKQSGNTAIGDSALYSQNFGTAFNSGNVAIGNSALYANNPASTSNSGNYNTAVGQWTLRNNITGYKNTALGAQALYSNTTGTGNVAIQYQGLYNNSTGSYNTAVGPGDAASPALYNNSSGNYNTAIGFDALWRNTIGCGNTANGAEQTLDYTTIACNNTATGFYAMVSSVAGGVTGDNNTATGAEALDQGGSGTGIDNTGAGYEALNTNTTASSNAALGAYSGYLNNTQGTCNTYVGDSADYNNTKANNTFVGYAAGLGNKLAQLVCLGWGSGSKGDPTIAPVADNIYIGNSLSNKIYAEVTTITAYSDRRIKDNIKENVPGLAFITKLHPVTYYLNIHRENKLLGVKNTEDWPGKYDVEKINQTGFIAQQVDSAARACNYDFCGISKPETPGGLYGLSYSSFVVPLAQSLKDLNDSLMVKRTELQVSIDSLQTENTLVEAQLVKYQATLKQVQNTNMQTQAKNAADIVTLEKMVYAEQAELNK